MSCILKCTYPNTFIFLLMTVSYSCVHLGEMLPLFGECFRRMVMNLDKEAASACHYLGLPLMIGCKRHEIFSFIKGRVRKQLHGWNRGLLSRAGKKVLLKSIAQAIPNYAMQIYRIPIRTCTNIERMLNSFWCCSNDGEGRGIHWTRWDKLCTSKGNGGFGFKKMESMNLALLAKFP